MSYHQKKTFSKNGRATGFDWNDQEKYKRFRRGNFNVDLTGHFPRSKMDLHYVQNEKFQFSSSSKMSNRNQMEEWICIGSGDKNAPSSDVYNVFFLTEVVGVFWLWLSSPLKGGHTSNLITIQQGP